MTKQLLALIFGLSFSAAFAQNELYNNGAEIFIQKNALVHVQGSFVNKDNGANAGITTNNGILELRGDFENVSGAEFKATDNTSTDRAVKFIGSGTQTIKGDVNTAGTASFYSLVIDKDTATDQVVLAANAVVEGALIFGDTSNSIYNPSAAYTHPNNKGIINTDTFLLDIRNDAVDAIIGQDSFAINNTATTGYVLTSGSKTNNGGLQRAVTTTSYEFPIATSENGYNPVRINFTGVSSGGRVKGKFNDVTGVGVSFATIDYEYPQYLSLTAPIPADNNGFNYFFAANACNGNAPQWLVLEDAITNHGYWSFEGTGTNASYQYDIEVYPTSFADGGVAADLTRVIKYSGVNYNANPSDSNWSKQIVSSVSSVSDLMTYTLNAGCYSGSGVPGGSYTGFSHFGVAKSKTGNSLPVELIYLQATPVNNDFIKVSWATALEINNDGFWVQRSTDGSNWTYLAWIDGNDNTTTQKDYFYDDNNVTPSIVYFYRLKQVDNDGAFEFTYIVNASLTGQLSFGVMDFVPNPTTDFSSLLVNSAIEQSINVKFYNSIGQQVLNERINLTKGANKIDFDLSVLAAGTYSGVVYSSNEVFTKKIVIAR